MPPPLTFLAPAAFPQRRRARSSECVPRAALIAVAGATGGVGRLVVSHLLADGHEVRALVRDVPRATAALPPGVLVAPVADSAALADVEVLVIATGTTAFPTRAWRGGNTPAVVDDAGVRRLVYAAEGLRRVVLLSSIGVLRVGVFPFSVLNLFGVLDAKRRGEEHLRAAAREKGFAYSIVRPGRLVGAPHTNPGALKREPHNAVLDVCVSRGDVGKGNLSRGAAADAVIASIDWPGDVDLEFSAIHVPGAAPQPDMWRKKLAEAHNVVLSTGR